MPLFLPELPTNYSFSLSLSADAPCLERTQGMRKKRGARPATAAIAKKRKTEDAPPPKVKFDQVYQRMSSVRMALGGAVADPAWVTLFRDVVNKMNNLTWIGSRAFNHFVLSNVMELFLINL